LNTPGILTFYHDSAAALIRNCEIADTPQEECHTHTTHEYGLPKNGTR